MRLDKGYRQWLIDSYAEAEATRVYCEDKLTDESRKFDFIWSAAQASVLQQSVYEALGYTNEASNLVSEMKDAAAEKRPEIEAHYALREKATGGA